ncbi:MAG TPA: tetratricopeptide repeat protein, partial [Polyangiaceae bacterium]
MRTRLRALLAVLGLFLVVLVPARAKAAGAEDAAALRTAQDVLDGEYSAGNFAEAKRKMEAALARCGRCAPSTQAPLHVLLGMIASQTGQKAEAKAQFELALQADPNAQLPPRTTPDIRAQWEEAKGGAGGEQGAEATPAPGALTPAGHIPGWNNVDAFQEASAGLAADMAGKLPECLEHDKKSLELEEQPRTRLHLSSCEARSAHLIDALQDAQKALEDGLKRRDPLVMKAARERVEGLL